MPFDLPNGYIPRRMLSGRPEQWPARDCTPRFFSLGPVGMHAGEKGT